MKEAKKAKDVVALSIGPKQCSETLRTALAMGCDRAIHIQTDLRTDYMELQPFAVAQLFQKIVEQEQSDLILLGKQAIDSDCGQTGPLLAGLMDLPQVTFASKIDFNDAGMLVERETDTGTETIQVKSTPAVGTSQSMYASSDGSFVRHVPFLPHSIFTFIHVFYQSPATCA